jgi:hypothetical protein
MSDALQLMALCMSFWVALVQYRNCEPDGQGQRRFACGLVLGAVSAHLGWALAYAGRILATPEALLRPVGWSVLFVPVGFLATAPWRESGERRDRFFASAASSLPLAFAIARLGCLAAGCCHGRTATTWRWGDRLSVDAGPSHSVVLVEIAALVVLQRLAGRCAWRLRLPVALGGFGLLRLAVEPWRVPPPLGAPWFDLRWIAGLWVGIAALAWTFGDRRPASFVGPGNRRCTEDRRP